MKKVLSVLFCAFFFDFCVVLAAARNSTVVAIPAWLLWNWLCPTLFHAPEVSIFQAWGLVALGSLLSVSRKNNDGLQSR